MSASPLLETATEGGLFVRGEPTVTTLPAASALLASARAIAAASPQVRQVRRKAAARPNSRHIPHPLSSIPFDVTSRPRAGHAGAGSYIRASWSIVSGEESAGAARSGRPPR